MKPFDYIDLRSRYVPALRKVIFVCESPPASGKYFYDPAGSVSEPLFRAIMADVLKVKASSKHDGLQRFAYHGFFLLDATLTPVNRMPDCQRKATILRDFPVLVDSLRQYAQPETVVALIKANICELLEQRIKAAGFMVLNNGVKVPFPACGQQKKFTTTLKSVLRSQAM